MYGRTDQVCPIACLSTSVIYRLDSKVFDLDTDAKCCCTLTPVLLVLLTASTALSGASIALDAMSKVNTMARWARMT